MSNTTLEQMKSVDIADVDLKDTVDIRSVVIDQGLPFEERVKSFLSQIRNPYCFSCDGVVVQIDFAQTDVTLEERMAGYIAQKYEHA